MSGPELPRFHVSPTANRESIRRHGLDWRRMDPGERGIANGWPGRPEAEGVFLTHPEIEDARWFAGMGGGRRVDVWRVDVRGLVIEDLANEGGWWICREPIPPERLELVEVWDTGAGFDELQPVPIDANERRRDRHGGRGSQRPRR
jgi:hypothetical protein